jgi:hypothetical protein
VASVALVAVSPAAAQIDPACAGDFNEIQCTAIVTRLDTLTLRVDGLQNTIDGTSGGVALSEDNTNRLDLAWWGAWAIAGLMLALMVAPMMSRAFRWWRE